MEKVEGGWKRLHLYSSPNESNPRE